MKELKLAILGAVVSALIMGYYAHIYTYPLIKDAVRARLHKELPELPDFQLMTVERVETEHLSRLRIAPRKVAGEQTGTAPEKPPAHRLMLTYLGERKNYAIIDGRLVAEGERISPHERVVKITEEKVLLSGRWGKRWLTLVD